jgi:hypothetical protein
MTLHEAVEVLKTEKGCVELDISNGKYINQNEIDFCKAIEVILEELERPKDTTEIKERIKAGIDKLISYSEYKETLSEQGECTNWCIKGLDIALEIIKDAERLRRLTGNEKS